MAAALMECVIQCLEEEDLMENAARLEVQVRERCCVGPVSSVQGAGLLLGLRTIGPAKEIIGELRKRGILVGGSADPNVMRLMPPLIINDKHVDALAAALQEISP
jgi:acetylornithine/succinyldiaminopimelate/putrescine aminotransferase